MDGCFKFFYRKPFGYVGESGIGQWIYRELMMFLFVYVQLTFIRLSSSTNCSKSFPNNFFMLLILITIFFIKCTQRQNVHKRLIL